MQDVERKICQLVIVIIIYYPSQPLVIGDQIKYAFIEMFVDDDIDFIECMKIS